MKCPNLEALFIQHVQVGILLDDKYGFQDEVNNLSVPTLYSVFLQKFFLALRNAKKLAVLRYFPYSI